MAGYTVTDTRQVQALTPAGTMREVYRVWIVTDKGATGSLDVSPDKWNAVALVEILEAFTATLNLAFEVAGG